MNGLHVKITATREQLHEMGVCSDATFDMLLSGRAMPVKRRETTGGKTLVYLCDPKDPLRDLHLWVYEEFCEPV